MGRRAAGGARRAAEAPATTGEVIGFYSHSGRAAFGPFSNFHEHNRPYEFTLPACVVREGFPTSVWCHFSEKAIMASKAALMGDLETFRKIEAVADPATCKALGRRVSPWDEERWNEHLEEIAFEVVRQKFAAEKELRRLLLSTGEAVIAEAAPNDRIWGIGLAVSDPRVQDPEQWRGRNVLGHALMRARSALRAERAAPAGTADPEAGAAATEEP